MGICDQILPVGVRGTARACRFRTTLKLQRWRPFADASTSAAKQQRMNLLLPDGFAAAAAPAAPTSRKRRPSTKRQSITAGPLAQPGPAFDDDPAATAADADHDELAAVEPDAMAPGDFGADGDVDDCFGFDAAPEDGAGGSADADAPEFSFGAPPAEQSAHGLHFDGVCLPAFFLSGAPCLVTAALGWCSCPLLLCLLCTRCSAASVPVCCTYAVSQTLCVSLCITRYRLQRLCRTADDANALSMFGGGFGSQLEGSQLEGSAAYQQLHERFASAVNAAFLANQSDSHLATRVRIPAWCTHVIHRR